VTSVTFTANVVDQRNLQSSLSQTFALAGTAAFTTTSSTLWGSAAAMDTVFNADSTPIEIGMRFFTLQPGKVTGIRFWKDPGNTDPSRNANLWTDTGTLLATAAFGAETSGTWNTATFGTPVTISPFPAVYRMSVSASTGYMESTNHIMGSQSAIPVWPLILPGVFTVSPFGAGFYSTTPGTFPNTGNNSEIYGVDVVFEMTNQVNPPVGPGYYSRWVNCFPTGATFFPIGVWQQSGTYSIAPLRYQSMNFNTDVTIFGWPPDNGNMEGAYAVGFNMMAGGDNNGGHQSAEFYVTNPTVSQISRSYTIGDELDSTTPTPGPVVQGYTNIVHSYDSTRPAYLNFALSGWSMLTFPGSGLTHADIMEQFVAADIVSCDMYAVSETDTVPTHPGIWVYGRVIDRMLQWVNYAKPVWGFVECVAGNGGAAITPTQMTQAVWMMLIHGARGIIYFDHLFWPPGDFNSLSSSNYPGTGCAVSGINAQVAALAAALNAPAVAGVLTVGSSNTSQAPPADLTAFTETVLFYGKGPGVQIDTTVRQPGDGFTYIFAIAGNPGITTGTFTLTGITGTTVTVLGESRTIAVTGGVFTDGFTSDYQYHLYRITT